jgi:hypothetical protein
MENNQITTINRNAFEYCSTLRNVTMPSSVTEIRQMAFDNCVNLTNIVFDGTTEQWNAITKGTYWNRNVPATYVQCSDGQVAL